MGKRFESGLQQIAQRYSFMGDIRGRGLMLGVEITKPGTHGRAGQGDGARARAIKLNCFDNGLIMETGGRHGAVLRFLPPLTITEAEVGMVLDRFEQALKKSGEARQLYAGGKA
jgi:diaminobutyrate-2-oxoglutarate transaminase